MSQPETAQLGDFLRSRRARIQPEDAGLQLYGTRRRVAGLRREEVAQLAGVSVNYYIRLEQGRGGNASDSVLDALAQVLRLTPTEAAHLRDLVRPPRPAAAASPAPGPGVRNGLRDLLNRISAPAFVLGRCMDVLAWNAHGDALYDFSAKPPGTANMARHAFLDPDGLDFYPDWTDVARDTIAYLRLDAARHPGDARLTAFINELAAANADFDRLWQEHSVQEKTFGSKRLHHPRLGFLDVGYETLALPGDADQLLVVYTAQPGTPAARAFDHLTPPA